jgi:hypothetical protein
MKKLAFILMAATIMVGCKKSEIAEAPPLTSPGMMAKIAGTSIDYGTPVAEKEMSTTGSETVFINAYNAVDGNSIGISLTKQGGITPGTYGIANGAVIGISDGTNDYGTTNSVSIKITSCDATHIVGSFSGTAVDPNSGSTTKSITEGRFFANF